MPVATDSKSIPETASGEAIPVAELGARLLAELEAGEAKGEEIEHLFERLERMINGESSVQPDGPPVEIEWKTSDVGNLEALQREYLWESERLGKEVEITTATRLASFVHSLIGMRIFEVEKMDELGLARALVQTWAEGDIQEVHDLMRDLVEWESWLAEVHEICFGTSMSQFRDALIQDAARLAKIEKEVQTVAFDGKDLPTLSWHVLNDPQGSWILESSHGRQALEQDSDFVVGDLILGALGEKGFRPGFRLVPRLLAQALTIPEEQDPV